MMHYLIPKAIGNDVSSSNLTHTLSNTMDYNVPSSVKIHCDHMYTW